MKTANHRALLVSTLALASVAISPEAILAEGDSFYSGDAREAAETYRRAAAEPMRGAEDTVALYRRAVALEGELLEEAHAASRDGIWLRLEEFLARDLDLPGVLPACVAECTYPALAIDLEFFAERAAKTPERRDDAFFELLENAWGSPVPIADGRIATPATIFERTWDYGGHSRLGSGAHLDLLSAIDALRALPGNKALESEVTEVRETVFRDLLEVSNCAGLSARAVIGEIDQILERIDLDEEERRALRVRRAAFADPTAHGIETDCQQRSCSCDSG